MNTTLFSSSHEMFAGLIIGILFGFFLQKANVTRSLTIVGQLLLKDFTVMKVIMTAIAVGSLGLYTFQYYLQNVEFIISSTTLAAALIGGGIFGIGMAILGYCPGTCVGALAEKCRNAGIGFVGMIIGAGLYAEVYPWIARYIKPARLINKMTIPQYFELSPWMFIGGICFVVLTWIFVDNFRKKNNLILLRKKGQ
jgi:uncharacterized protein